MRYYVLELICLIVATSWWPSHQFFKWLRKNHNSIATLLLSIVSCSVVTVLVVGLGILLGRHINNLNVRSLWSSASGSSSPVNLFWMPFALLSLGVWAGFLSGFVKMKIDD